SPDLRRIAWRGVKSTSACPRRTADRAARGEERAGGCSPDVRPAVPWPPTMRRMEDIDRVRDYLTGLQDRICTAIETADGSARFAEDSWAREEGGGGRTRVLREGAVFEQAGIGFSDVSGTKLPPSATAARPELAGASWRAVGVSLVFHPRNPHVPTTHANVRHFRAVRDGQTVAWWFGGGFDLTPFYPVDADVLHWHRTARDLCAPFGDDRYAAHKRWCDEYF